MKRLFLALALLASPVAARDLSITLTDADQQTLIQALDSLMKTQGLTSLTNGTAAAVQTLFTKLQQAAQQPDTPKSETPK